MRKPIKQPAQAYPQLVERLAEISVAAYDLYKKTQPEAMGKNLGITKQGFQKHVAKLRNGTPSKTAGVAIAEKEGAGER